jgi:hypothetical protein
VSRRSVRREHRHGISRRRFLLRFGAAATVLPSRTPLHALAPDSISPFLLEGDDGTISSLRFRGDRFPTDCIEPGQNLGDIGVVWRRPGRWLAGV